MLANNISQHLQASRAERGGLSGAETAMNHDERNETEGAAEEPQRAAGEENIEKRDRGNGRDDNGDNNRDVGRDGNLDGNVDTRDAAGAADRDTDAPAPAESEELARMREAMLRLKAEMDNREKRLEREMVKSRKFALEALMRDLVQVLDSMDQALASADADHAQAAYEGLELTRKQALQVLTSHGLEVLDPLGERFDPSWHEAMATQPSDEYEPDNVAKVLQKGYRLNERLIRPARVMVAK